jgi:hypothetical protein
MASIDMVSEVYQIYCAAMGLIGLPPPTLSWPVGVERAQRSTGQLGTVRPQTLFTAISTGASKRKCRVQVEVP